MISFWRDKFCRQTWHPSFEDLMLYLDGELRSKGDQVGDHTKRCWSCRVRLEKINKAISEFMDLRNASFAGSARLPNRALLNFDDRLSRLEAEPGHSHLFSSMVRQSARGLLGPQVTAQAVTFVALVGLSLAVLFRMSLTPPVSASEVLLRARRAEDQQIGRVPSPVIYQKLRLSRRSGSQFDSVTWEIWDDTDNKRLRQRAGGAGEGVEHAMTLPSARFARNPRPVGELAELFSIHQADLGRPLCAANYETWRSAIPQMSEKVLEGQLANGDKTTILEASAGGYSVPETVAEGGSVVRAAAARAPLSVAGSALGQDSDATPRDLFAGKNASPPEGRNDDFKSLTPTAAAGREAGDMPPAAEPRPNRILKAKLIVRTRDWHPVEEHLWVDEGEYKIAELDFKVMPLAEVDAVVFAEPPLPVEPVIAPRPLPTDMPTSLVPPPPDPEETEMAVRYGLHQLTADLGEPIEISRDSQDRVVVDASNVSPELQAKLTEQFGSLPNIGLNLGDPKDVACTDCLAPSQETADLIHLSPHPIAPVVNPNRQRLEEIFGDPNAQESFTREVVAVSGDALSHCFALRGLALRYPAEEEARLTPIPREQLEGMVNDHFAALIEINNHLQGLLRPLLEALSKSPTPNVDSPEVMSSGVRADNAAGSLGREARENLHPDSDSSWQDATFTVFAAAQKADALVIGLLPDTNNSMPADQVVPQLRQVLSELQKALNQHQVQTPILRPKDK